MHGWLLHQMPSVFRAAAAARLPGPRTDHRLSVHCKEEKNRTFSAVVLLLTHSNSAAVAAEKHTLQHSHHPASFPEIAGSTQAGGEEASGDVKCVNTAW